MKRYKFGLSVLFTPIFSLLLFAVLLQACSSEQLPLTKTEQSVFNRYVGDWQGQIESTPGQFAPIVLHLNENPEAETSPHATIGSPYQNVFALPLNIQFDGESSVTFTNGEFDLVFSSQLGSERITGKLVVQGHQFPIEFKRQTEGQKQELVHLMPGLEPSAGVNETAFSATNGEVTLSGTLSLPDGTGPFPAVVLISGSGPDGRDYEKYGHRRFQVLAEHLTKSGIAVVRYDERGVGESSGDYASATLNDFASDVAVLLEALYERGDIDNEKVGLIGHSEGGMVASLVASENKLVDFSVLLATLADRKAGLTLQYGQIGAAMGHNPRRFTDAALALESRAKTGVSAAELEQFYLTHFQSELPLSEGFLKQTSMHMTSAVMVSFLNYEPGKVLSKITTPVLTMCGELDHYFDCKTHSSAVSKLIEQANNKQLEQKTYAQLNHYLQTAKTGTMAEEPKLNETISLELMSDLSKWILQL